MSESVAPELDPAAAFLALCAFRGDVLQAAEALRVPTDDLKTLSARYDWPTRLRSMGVSPGGAASNKQDATTRAQNRALNLVQAIRLREVVDRVTVEVLSSPEKLAEFTTVTTKNGTKRDLRTITDLVNAANVAQQMTSRALQDHADNEAPDREALRGQELSIELSAALDAAAKTGLPSSEVVRSLEDHKG